MMEHYSQARVLDLYKTRQDLRRAEISIFEKHVKPGWTVLDIGCGLGRTAVHLHERGCRVIAIDLAPGMIATARSLHPELDLRVMNATALTLDSESVDMSLFSFNGLDCISPLSQRYRALSEMGRVTRRGGLVVFSSHNLRARILNRFRSRGFFEALRSTANELCVANFWWRRPYIRHTPMEGEITTYMGTVGRHLRHVARAAPALQLLRVVGQDPADSLPAVKLSSETVYYVWRKP